MNFIQKCTFEEETDHGTVRMGYDLDTKEGREALKRDQEIDARRWRAYFKEHPEFQKELGIRDEDL